MAARVGAVVVTHRSERQVPGLLQTLAEHEPDVKAIVVDSGSPDVPRENRVPVLPLSENVGFGTACNRGAEALLADRNIEVVAFLNPDVRLAAPSLTQLAAMLDERPDVGVATGPVIGSRGEPQPSAWGPTSSLRAFWFASGWHLPTIRRVVGRLGGNGLLTSSTSLSSDDIDVDGHVLGGAMLVRRTCWEQLGGFDENFFLYWEDADLCARARALGWRVSVLPCTPIVHESGTSSAGVTDDHRWSWYVEGADRFAHKHLSRRSRRRLMAALRLGRRVPGSR